MERKKKTMSHIAFLSSDFSTVSLYPNLGPFLLQMLMVLSIKAVPPLPLPINLNPPLLPLSRSKKYQQWFSLFYNHIYESDKQDPPLLSLSLSYLMMTKIMGSITIQCNFAHDDDKFHVDYIYIIGSNPSPKHFSKWDCKPAL